jgi:hypothetical protein
MNWTVITAIVAVYGALLSTWNVLSTNREKRRRVKVRVSYGFATYGSTLGPNGILITAQNIGHQPITLNSAGIRLPDGRTVIALNSIEAPLPQELAGGKSHNSLIEVKVLAETMQRLGFSGMVRVVGFYRDALGKAHESSGLKFDVAAGLRSE